MTTTPSNLEAIQYKRGSLEILDQLLLPFKTVWVTVRNTDEGWSAIHHMQVRGAPAIAIVACLSLALELHNAKNKSKAELGAHAVARLRFLLTSRPTAVNLSRAVKELEALIQELLNDENVDDAGMKERLITAIEAMLVKDRADNHAIGEHGANAIENHSHPKKSLRILTHCNTGSLATAGYGTALGVIRSLHARKTLNRAFCTETRPYNQGSRLTSYELMKDAIPSTLICDSMVAAAMQLHGIDAVVVGADRVARNGDTANKIGTYQLAILAKYHNVPFYVAAPTTSIDFNIANGKSIVIEERPAVEMTHIMGVQIALTDAECWNPAFDVTKAELITGGIITELGVYAPSDLETMVML